MGQLKTYLKRSLPVRLRALLRQAHRLVICCQLRWIECTKVPKGHKIAASLGRKEEKLLTRIQTIHYRKFGTFLDVLNPTSYNEKIQWLKVFDQDAKLVDYCDKLKVREFVERRVGAQYLPKLYQSGERFSDLDFSQLPSAYVVKTNHDSGTVFLVRHASEVDLNRLKRELTLSLSLPYGVLTAELPYMRVERKVFVEELLNPEGLAPPADYKFHCVEGEVRWLQYIFDRGTATKEAHFDREFDRLFLHLDLEFQLYDGAVTRPDGWDEMIEVAEKLSNGFKYVRVDLYNIGGAIYFGELTLYPKGGFYPGVDAVEFGRYLDFSIDGKKETVYF